MASGRADYIQKWLDPENLTPIAADDGSGCTAADVEPDHNEHNQGLAIRLYQLSRQGLQQLCRQEEHIPRLNSSQFALREELGKLYLWGEAFENGKLDKALEQSEDLSDTVLEFLCAIGNIIIRASQPYPKSTVESAAIPEQIQDLKILIEQAKSIISRNFDQASSEGSEDEGEYGVSKEEVPGGDNDIAGELQLHIGCLVDLGSTLEKSFLCTESGRVRSSQLVPVPFHVSDATSERQVNSAMRLMVPNPNDALEPVTLPPIRRPDQEPIFECPFTFLKCFRQFAISNEGDWIQHSLEHFRTNKERPRRVDPPKMNSCCFCPQTFQASSGITSWRARMDHVKVHQKHFGHRLATARHDFALVEHLWQEGVLSLADYRELRPTAAAASRSTQNIPTPGLLSLADYRTSNPKAKAVEEDPQSLSPRDPGSLVDVKVVSKAPHDTDKKAVHCRRK